tara:strand:+ start:1662 stop:2087 length:426 start_codon:yes stop_codon:yes gene_type:complete
MFQVIPFQAAHLGAIRLQESQVYLSEWVTDEQAHALADHPSYTALDGNTVLGAAGVIPIWQGRAMAWSFISRTGPQNFLKCHNVVKRFLAGCYVQRIEMTVDCDTPAAHRWARLLGFEMEAERMRGYSPDGRDCALYARVL